LVGIVGKKSKQWYHAHINDPYVKAAKAAGYRSRAAFKLLELQQQVGLLKKGMVVVDLGSAPGSWSEVAVKQVGARGRVLAIDLLSMAPVSGVLFFQGDFTQENQVGRIIQALDGQPVDVVMSDMSPNISGVASADQLRMMALAQQALAFCQTVLQPKGRLVIKLFHGVGFDEFVSEVKKIFLHVEVKKPKASKSRSKEVYLFAQTFRAIMSDPAA
jgi:23S rRNA (uridine2552-2'-O)-methyltransferase